MVTDADIYKVVGVRTSEDVEFIEITPQYVYVCEDQETSCNFSLHGMAFTKTGIDGFSVEPPENLNDTIKITYDDQLFMEFALGKTKLQVESRFFKGRINDDLVSQIDKFISQLIKNSKNNDFKIGVTANPAQRFTYYLNDKSASNKTWKKMVVLYEAKSSETGYKLETALIKKRDDGRKVGSLNNTGPKETGLRTEGMCFVYIVVD